MNNLIDKDAIPFYAKAGEMWLVKDNFKSTDLTEELLFPVIILKVTENEKLGENHLVDVVHTGMFLKDKGPGDIIIDSQVGKLMAMTWHRQTMLTGLLEGRFGVVEPAVLEAIIAESIDTKSKTVYDSHRTLAREDLIIRTSHLSEITLRALHLSEIIPDSDPDISNLIEQSIAYKTPELQVAGNDFDILLGAILSNAMAKEIDAAILAADAEGAIKKRARLYLWCTRFFAMFDVNSYNNAVKIFSEP